MRSRDERGAATLEAVIVMPAFTLFVVLIILAGRLAITGQTVAAAAAQAARTATVARSPDYAQTRARTVAAQHLTGQNAPCSATQVTVDTTGFDRPLGTPAEVTVTVTCTVSLADLTLPGLPGSRTVTATATSPLDPYRGR